MISASTSRAGTKWQMQQLRAEPSALSNSAASTHSAVPGHVIAIGSLRSNAAGHVDRKVARLALRMAAQIHPEGTSPSKAVPEAKYSRLTRSMSVKLELSSRGIRSMCP